MSDARETAPESPSGEPLDTAPTDTGDTTGTGETEDADELLDPREPYDADGVFEPRRDGAGADDLDAGTDDIAAEPLDDDQL
ncbi:hypothetical protein [Leifsonia sp. PS1209]|uniref:hypothetical protein n=1 Tax=Leifsonia sp. PS1209 TaxID=2724914 RepID=UPI001442A655|nr:hypothetical protein [Leifsonia sp. PS1209]QIZ98768.1 hypothetical protein HF024_09820 [Leifsonia sp. PS1209]